MESQNRGQVMKTKRKLCFHSEVHGLAGIHVVGIGAWDQKTPETLSLKP